MVLVQPLPRHVGCWQTHDLAQMPLLLTAVTKQHTHPNRHARLYQTALKARGGTASGKKCRRRCRERSRMSLIDRESNFVMIY